MDTHVCDLRASVLPGLAYMGPNARLCVRWVQLNQGIGLLGQRKDLVCETEP